jgi:hypothetical protein
VIEPSSLPAASAGNPGRLRSVRLTSFPMLAHHDGLDPAEPAVLRHSSAPSAGNHVCNCLQVRLKYCDLQLVAVNRNLQTFLARRKHGSDGRNRNTC